MSKKRGVFLSLLMAALWGTSFPFSQVVLRGGVGQFELLAIRFIISAIILSIVFYKQLKGFKKHEIMLGLKCGVSLFLGMAFQVSALKFTSSSNTAFLTMLYIVVVPVLSVIFYKYEITKSVVLSVILAVIGTALVSFAKGFGGTINIGDLLAVISSVFIAFQMLFLGKKESTFNPNRVTIVEMGVVGVLSVISMFIFKQPFVMPTHVLGSVIYLTLIPGCLCFALQTYCQRILDVYIVTILFTFECVFATIFSILILHETLTIIQVLGFIAILAAAFVVLVPKKKE